MSENLFFSYYEAFELAAREDDFSAVRSLLTDDAIYEVEGVPFACRVEGADAIVAGMRRSLAGFDRRFDSRLLGVMGAPRSDGERTTVDLLAVWERAGQPALVVEVPEDIYARDGRIHRIHDRYQPARMSGALAWLERYGADLDARYV